MSDERNESEGAEPLALESWGADRTAPPELRGRVLEAARSRGLVEGGIMSKRGFWMGAVATAAALMFVVGFGLGSRQAGKAGDVTQTKPDAAPTAATTTPKFALFLFEDAAYQSPPDDQMMARVGEYGGWARDLAVAGRYVDGEKLADDGRFCRVENGALAAVAPQADAKRGRLTGYFVIGAASLDDAMEVAKGCPHLKYGGTVEIRQIES